MVESFGEPGGDGLADDLISWNGVGWMIFGDAQGLDLHAITSEETVCGHIAEHEDIGAKTSETLWYARSELYNPRLLSHGEIWYLRQMEKYTILLLLK